MSIDEVIDTFVLLLYAQEGTVAGPKKRQAIKFALRYLIRLREMRGAK